jgi:hypothetical protein
MSNFARIEICGINVNLTDDVRFTIENNFKSVVIVLGVNNHGLIGKKILESYKRDPSKSYIKIYNSEGAETYSIGEFDSIYHDISSSNPIGIKERLSIVLKEEVS